MAAPPPPYAQHVAVAPPYNPGGYPPQGQYPPGTQPPVVVVAAQPAYFGRYPVNMTCGNCQAQIQTQVRYETGVLTWIICLALFFFTIFCFFIPFLVDACKDAVHHCPACKSFVGRRDAIS